MSDVSLLQRVADELEILRLLAKVAQSVDDLDEEAYRSCFTDEVLCPASTPREGGGWQTVSSKDYARRAIASASDMDWTHHGVFNGVVTLDGIGAKAVADVVVEMQASDDSGKPERLTIGGRYELELTRAPEGWRIAKRALIRRYAIGSPDLIERAHRRPRPNEVSASVRIGSTEGDIP